MARPFQPGFVTANDVISGVVIYLAANGDWTPAAAKAERIADAARAEARLRLAEDQPEIAVSPYFAAESDLREAMRATGPTAPAQVSWGAAAGGAYV